jgi:four helix bundle protein
MYGLTSQIRRCSASIAANIAEGCGKPEQRRVSAVLSYCDRVSQRIAIPFSAGERSPTCPTGEYEALNKAVVEIKRMLAALVLKVERERFAS